MDTRTRIVETASRLFYTQGYNSTGINQVIKEADVAKASLYQHFKSKEELLEEYLKRTAETTNQVLQAVVEQQESPRDKVLAVFDLLLKTTADKHYNGCNFLNISAEFPQDNSAVRGLVRKQKDHIRFLFTTILQPAGQQHLADELYLLFDAALSSSKVYNDAWPVNVARKIAEKLV